MLRFGIYLIGEGLVNSDQLVAALELQQASIPPLGQIALEAGKLTVREVFSIVRVQSDLPNDKFGNIAIELGLLTRKELAELLLLQSDRRPPLHDILVRQGVLTRDQAREALQEFRKAMERGGNPGAKTYLVHQHLEPPVAADQLAEDLCYLS